MVEVVERPKPLSVTVREAARRVLAHENAALGIVLASVIGVMAGLSRGQTISRINMSDVLVQSSIRGVAAVGQAFCILTANFDLSVAGVAVMNSMLGGVMMTASWQNILGYQASPLMAIPVMLAVGASWGMLSGTLVSRAGIPSLIVTFGIWQIGYGVGFWMTRGESLMELPQSLAVYGKFPVAPIIFFSVAAVAYFVLNYTSFGRSVYATGGSPVSAYLSGINVKNIQRSVFIISGLCAGLAGAMWTSRAMASSTEGLRGLEINSIASVVIGGVSLFGGRGTIIGVVFGALIIGVIINAVNVMGAGHAVKYITQGGIIIAAVGIDMWRRRGR